MRSPQDITNHQSNPTPPQGSLPGTPTPFSHQHAAARETNSNGLQNAAAPGAHSHAQAVHSETQGSLLTVVAEHLSQPASREVPPSFPWASLLVKLRGESKD